MMRTFLLVQFAISLVIAQDIAVQYFQNTDDISQAYYQDSVLTFDQYVELLQLFEEKVDVNTGNLYRLLVIPGVERSDIDALAAARMDRGPFKSLNQVRAQYPGDFDLIEPFLTVVPPTKINISGYAKIYTRRDYSAPPEYNDPYHKAKFFLKYKNISADITIRQQGDGMGLLSARSLQYKSRGFKAILGTYYREELGYGLLVGRYISLSSDRRDNDAIGYLLSPSYGDMNGLYLSWQISPRFHFAAAISGNWYKSSEQSLLSASVDYRKARLGKIGVVIYRGSVSDVDEESGSDATYSQSGASVFGELKFEGWRLRSEVGLLNDGTWGTQCFLSSPRGRGASFLLKFWAYHTRFRPLYSDGEADRGTQSFYPEDFDFYLKSRQAGEVGSSASLRFPVARKLTAEANIIYFNVSNTPDNGGKAQISVKYRPGKGKYINCYIDRRWDGWGEAGNTKDRVSTSWRWRFSRKVELQGYSSFNWYQYEDDSWRNGYRIYTTVWYEPIRGFEIGLKPERNDGNIDDPEYGYWGISLTPRLDVAKVDWKTEFSFRKYDDEERWTLSLRVNALMGW